MAVTRKFDTGLVDELGRPVAFRTYVRNKVIELLSRRFNANTGELDPNGVGIRKEHGGFLEIVKLAGPLPAYDSDEGVKQLWSVLLGRSPAIGVAIGDREQTPAGIGGFQGLAALDVHLYFTNNHSRSLIARVEGDLRSTGDGAAIEPDLTADAGIDVAMELAEQLLVGQRPEAERATVKQIVLRRETIGIVNNTHVIAEQRYLIGVARTIDRTRGMVRLLQGIDTIIHPPGEPASPAAVTFKTEVVEPP